MSMLLKCIKMWVHELKMLKMLKIPDSGFENSDLLKFLIIVVILIVCMHDILFYSWS